MHNLLDEFSKEGTDITAFKEELAKMDACTSFVQANSSRFQLLSLSRDDKDKIYVYRLYSETIKNPERISLHSLTKAKLRDKGLSDALMQELVKDTKLLFYDGQKIIITSKNFLSGLYMFGIKGRCLDNPCLARDMLIAKQFADNAPCTLVIREVCGIQKIFAILGPKYSAVKQRIIIDIIDAIDANTNVGSYKCHAWKISQFVSEVYIEYPQLGEQLRKAYGITDEIIPGIWVASSDTGDSSIKIRGTWRLGHAISLHGEVKRRHTGHITTDELLPEIQSQILDGYAKFCDKLCGLKRKIIVPSAVTERDRKQNKTLFANNIKTALKKLNFTKAVGIKTEIVLRERICESFDPAQQYSAYDIAMLILRLSEAELTDSAKELLQIAISGAVDIF